MEERGERVGSQGVLGEEYHRGPKAELLSLTVERRMLDWCATFGTEVKEVATLPAPTGARVVGRTNPLEGYEFSPLVRAIVLGMSLFFADPAFDDTGSRPVSRSTRVGGVAIQLRFDQEGVATKTLFIPHPAMPCIENRFHPIVLLHIHKRVVRSL